MSTPEEVVTVSTDETQAQQAELDELREQASALEDEVRTLAEQIALIRAQLDATPTPTASGGDATPNETEQNESDR